MRFYRDKPVVSIAVAAALLVLLPVLAALQYKWIGEVSNAERERMTAGLRVTAARLAGEFNGELARAYLPLHLARTRLGPPVDTAPHPILRRFYSAQFGPDGRLALSVWRPERQSFEPTEWPAHLEPLRVRLEKPRGFREMAFVDTDIPAVIAPIFEGDRRPPEISGWSIGELDLNFIREEFLPELVESHFGAAGRADYRISVVEQDEPEKIIYSTDKSPEPAGVPDASVGLLHLRPEAGRRFRGFRGGPPAGMPGGPPGGPPGAPMFRWGDEGAAWRLTVRHRAGSLEAAVAQVRRRNMAISSVILMLMGAGMIMLVVSARRAQRLARLQMEFVAGVSHELKTPLAVICSAADNLAEGVVSTPPQVLRYGGVIRNEGRRLTEMVDQILGFAGMQIRPQPTSVAEVIDRAVTALEPQLQQSGCSVEKHVDSSLPPVSADPRWLSHAIQNLLSNALKYGDGKWIGIRSEPADAKVLVHIEDHGPGIDPHDLPHLFEPFYRGRKATESQIHGVGLGLNLVKRIAEAHGGSVTVESTPGQGARFTLSLPLAA
jgi:signal transduction histidine kinase